MLNFFFIFLNILLATGIFVFFRLVPQRKAIPIQVLAINYWTALIIAFFFVQDPEYGKQFNPWVFWRSHVLNLPNPEIFAQFSIDSPMMLPASIIMGILFVAGYLTSLKSTLKTGVGITSAATKMSVVIPVFVSIFLLKQNENLILKITGLVCVLASFFFIFSKNEKNILKPANYLLTFLVFLFAGLVDSGIDLSQHFLISSVEEKNSFLFLTFLSATVFSSAIALFSLIKYKQKPEWIAVALGVIIGLLNYYSGSLMIKNLQEVGSAVFFPVLNSSVVVFGAFAGIFFFKEKLTLNTCIGFLFAILGVILVAIV